MYILIGIIAAIGLIALILVLTKKPSPDAGAPKLDKDSTEKSAKISTETSPKEEETDKHKGEIGFDDQETKPQEHKTDIPPAAEEEIEPPITDEETAEGVRLDETAEQTAVQNLKLQRRERKLQKLRHGLSKTRGGLIAKIGTLFKGKKEISAELVDELEEVLITSDVGSNTTEWLLSLVREALDKDELKDPEAVWGLLKQEIKHALNIEAQPWDFSSDKPFTIMVVGVNGAGKTTTIGKLASQLTQKGHKIVLAAADTFRAAAVNQLEIWGRRTDSEVVKPAKEGADPSSVVFDAIKKAKEVDADIVIVDTAGRLHTQAPLMEELKKINRVMGKAHENAPHEILLVLDATNGQNALQQVKEFGSALQVTGLALTKLDGTAKGGVIIGICHEHKIPVRYIGIGEAKDSLREFDVDDFVDALFLQETEDE